MSTMTLTEFLTARIAEDQQRAIQGDAVDRKTLRECEAKRQLMDLHSPTDQAQWYGDDDPPEDGLGIGCETCGTANEYAVRWPCRTLALLAAVYADHADYRPEWAT